MTTLARPMRSSSRSSIDQSRSDRTRTDEAARSAAVRQVTIPGSKSATARGYVLAALADGPSVLSGVLDARDTRLMRRALEGFGVNFTALATGVVKVIPPSQFGASEVKAGLAGTIMRFLPPIAALAKGQSSFDGDPEAQRRPVRPLLDGLRQAGVEIDSIDRPPFKVMGTGAVRGGDVTIDASGSSQFLSGLLMAAARFEHGLNLTHIGNTVPSRPHVDLTVSMLRDRGVQVDALQNEDRWVVTPGRIAPKDELIEPDLINAATFLAIPLVTGGSVTTAWPEHTRQAEDAIVSTLEALGGIVVRGDGKISVTGDGRVRAADLDLSRASELTCIVAALLALADGPGRIRGVAHVRGHETDRLAALETEINELGGRVKQTDDGLLIYPRPLGSGIFHTYADHRMAHAASILGLAFDGIRPQELGCTTKTLPNFSELWVQATR